MDKYALEGLVRGGATLDDIARFAGVDRVTVRRWLITADLKTARMDVLEENREGRAAGVRDLSRRCRVHGEVAHRMDARGTYRCMRCNADRVSDRRRAVKDALVFEAGGACVLCGYDRSARALSFHHLDPATKEFNLALGGQTRALERARAEAAKCVLLCANCHMEVEDGIAEVALESSDSDPG